MSADTSKMEEVINKPDDQFEDTLIDLIDYNKETSEKEALIKELYQNETANHHIKPAASINSSNYSSAASSSSSSSNSSTNSTSSTSSTLSSPSQSNLSAPKSLSSVLDKDNPTKANGNELEEIEMAILEDLGKTATIVEHRVSDSCKARYIKNFVTATTPYQFHESNSAYRPAMNNHRSRSASHNLANHKNSGSRKKRPVEQSVLSQHIPGHKGEQEVDWLVNFIESRDSNAQNNKKNHSNSRRAKSQPKKSNQLDNDRVTHQSRKTHTVNCGRSSSSSCSSSSSSSRNSDSSSGNNIIMVNGGGTRSNNHNSTNSLGSVKSFLNHPRLSQSSQPKATQSNQQMPQPQISQRKSQPPTIIDQQQQPTNHQVSNSAHNKPSRPHGAHREPNVAQAFNKPNVKSVSKKQNQDCTNESKGNHDYTNAAVTFADHIRVIDDDETTPYTFGFFDEQKPKLMKTSPKSDRRRYIFNDNIDANSFNYQQILEFVSNAWDQTMAKKKTNESK